MNNTLKYIVAGLVGAAVLAGIALVAAPGEKFGARVYNDNPVFSNGLRAGTSETQVIDSSGNWDGPITASSLLVDSGCATATWNPGAVSSTTTAATTVTITGLAAGDIVTGSIDLPLQGLGIMYSATSTNTGYAELYALDADMTAVNLATTTLRMCQTH